MTYEVVIDDEMEDFLEWYLKLHPLRSEHTKNDYPNLVINNFLRGMRERMTKDNLYRPRMVA